MLDVVVQETKGTILTVDKIHSSTNILLRRSKKVVPCGNLKMIDIMSLKNRVI
jgi:hypothetical protein